MATWTERLRRLALGVLTASVAGGVVLYLAAPHPPRLPREARDLAGFEEFLNRLVTSGSPPGLSVSVVKDGRVVYDRAFGLADGPRGVSATPETVYHWWSMTKIPTAIAVLQLAERGLVDIDSPVADYLPWFAVDPPSPDSPAVTVRQLLNHSSGLPDTIPAMIGWVHYDDAGRDQTELVKRHLPDYRRLHFVPGSEAAYSNLNYMVLGALIEGVTGQTYERYVTEQVLRPLGMDRTDFAYTPELSDDEAAGSLPVVHFYTPMLPFLLDAGALVREHQGGLLWLRRVYLDATPPSGLIGPAPDAARLMIAYLEGGEIDGARVLAPESARAMTYEGQVGGRGLGWEVHRVDGRLHVQHPGGGPGFATLMRLYPEEGLGIVVLANGTDLDRDGLADLLGSMNWDDATGLRSSPQQ